MPEAPSSFRRTLYWRTLAFILPYWRGLVLVLGISVVAALLGLAQPYFLKILIDDAFLAGNLQMLLAVSAGVFLVSILSFFLNAFSGYRYIQVSAAALFDMRLALFRHLQKLSPRFYASRPTGDLLSRLNSDVSEIQRVASEIPLSLLTNTVILIGTVGLLIHLEPRLFLVSLVTLPPSIWFLRRFRSRISQKNLALRESSAEIGSFLIESMLGMRQTVAFSQEERAAATFRQKNDSFVAKLLDLQITNFLASGVPGTLLSFSTLVVFLAGGYLVMDEQLSMGGFVAFTAYQARLMGPIQGLMGSWLGLQAARASLERVFHLFDEEPEVKEIETPRHLNEVRGQVELDEVVLDYGRGAAVLDGVSFEIPAGQAWALVGPSGVGKSTVADLLLRRVDPERGVVRLDGHDLAELSLEQLRNSVAVVEQDTFLFNATIEENLRFGNQEASPDDLEKAVRAAVLEDFITDLPEGLATPVGERGLKLSAGQRQRIAVARALLSRPRVLILDEATSALDGEAEQQMIAAIKRLIEGSTTLILSHRLPLVAMAEHVLVLDRGRIVESGTLPELMVRDGAFKRLFGGEATLQAVGSQ